MSGSFLRPIRPIKRMPFVEDVLPLLNPSGLKPSPAKPASHNPCRGLGLDTPENQQAFVREFKKLQKEWPSITGRLDPFETRPEVLCRRIEQIANAQLQRVGVPPVSVVPAFLSYFGGEFHSNLWQIKIDRLEIRSRNLSDAEASKLAGLIYHECRHAEQAYLVSRMQAAALGAKGTTAEQALAISRRTLGPPRIAAHAHRHPLGVRDPANACAQTIYASQNDFADPAWRHSVSTYSALPGLHKAEEKASSDFDSAKEDYTKMQQNRHASQEMVQQAQAKMQAAQQRLQAAAEARRVGVEAYKHLPNEADAYETGDALEKSY